MRSSDLIALPAPFWCGRKGCEVCPKAFSRVSPTQKLHVIRGLQRAGVSVIMIGDGVNDAPALRAADVGLGIGRESTNAARDIAQAHSGSLLLANLAGGGLEATLRLPRRR